MKKEFIQLSSVLCIITLVAGLLLSGVNAVTEPRIALAEKMASEEAMKKIIPEADSFEPLTESVTIASKGDNKVGYCVKVESAGYGGNIVMMVAIGEESGELRGIEILSHSETAGLGAKIENEEFKNQFQDKSTELEVVKKETDSPYEVTAITGATVSSRAVVKGIEQATVLIEEALKEAGK